jgi:hypothetical protein
MVNKTITLVLLLSAILVFGYSQYASALQINAKILQNNLIQKSENNARYNLQLEFNNPSLLFLTAGKTEFTIISDDKIIGKGQLDAFSLPALGTATTDGVWIKDQSASENSQIKISGITKYQLLFTSVDLPFTYYPSYEQNRKFIADS